MNRIMSVAAYCAAMLLATAVGAAELKNGAEFAMNDVPEELTVHLKRGGTVRFLLEENGTTGYQWEATYAKNECTVAIEHRGAGTSNGLCGAPGAADPPRASTRTAFRLTCPYCRSSGTATGTAARCGW